MAKEEIKSCILFRCISDTSPHDHSICLASWDDERRVICFGEEWARGLTKTLDAEFAPQFSFSVALKQVADVKAKKHGRSHGNKIDKILSDWANSGIKPKTDNLYFLAITKALESLCLIPISAQIPVGCLHLRLATKIDLLCQNLKGQYCLIELKCGFDDYWDICGQGNFNAPFDHIPMSFRNKSFLQLFMTLSLIHI